MIKRLCRITALLVLLAMLILPSMPVLAQGPTEIVSLRTESTKTYDLGGGKYQLVSYPIPVHYKDNPDDPLETYKEISTSIIPSERANWQYEVTKGRWHLLVKDDTTIAAGRGGYWIGSQVTATAYLDWSTKQYVILQTRQPTTPTINGNSIRWDGIFYGINLEYKYIENKLRENLEVTQAARDWATAHPPSAFGLNNATSYFGFVTKMDWQQAGQAEDDNGNLIDWTNALETTGQQRVIFRDALAEFTPSYAYVDDEQVNINKRFVKNGNDYFMIFGAKATELNQLPSGTIVFDPDTFYPDANPETTSVDGTVEYYLDNQTWATVHDALAGHYAYPTAAAGWVISIGTGSTSNWLSIVRGFFLFDTSALPDTAVISAATLSIYGIGKSDTNSASPTINIYASTPASNTDLVAGDYDQVAATAFSTAITYASWNTAGYNDFALNASGLAAISKTGVSKFGTREASYDVPNSAPTRNGNELWSRLNAHYAEQGNGYKPKLVVTYSVPPAAPTNVAATDGTHTDKVVVTWTGSANATGYKVYEGANLLDTLGDVATYDDTAAPAGLLTSGTATASDGDYPKWVRLLVAGDSTTDGASRTYHVVAFNIAGDSPDSNNDTGYRGVGAITYLWYRSLGDSDAAYVPILTSTTNPYDDPYGVIDPDGRYYKAEVSATGAVSQNTTADRGYMSTLSKALIGGGSVAGGLVRFIVAALALVMVFMVGRGGMIPAFIGLIIGVLIFVGVDMVLKLGGM